MILEQELTVVGMILKPHGIMGEVTCSFSSEIDFENTEFFILCVDGIFVPFYVDSYRGKKSDTMILKFDGVNSEEEAKSFVGADIYLPCSFLDDEEQNLTYHYFVGFTVEDRILGTIGEIDDVDDATENVLFVVGDKLIPVVMDFIEDVDHSQKILYTRLPEGLLEL